MTPLWSIPAELSALGGRNAQQTSLIADQSSQPQTNRNISLARPFRTLSLVDLCA